MVICRVQFLNDHDITYCPEHVFYDVRVSSTLLYVMLLFHFLPIDSLMVS